jgi:predicted nuclease with TOPRIM domain
LFVSVDSFASQYDELVCKVDQQEQELFVLREKMKTVHDVEEMIDRLGELEVQQEELEQKNDGTHSRQIVVSFFFFLSSSPRSFGSLRSRLELGKENDELKQKLASRALDQPPEGEMNALKLQLAEFQKELARLNEENALVKAENESLKRPSTYEIR